MDTNDLEISLDDSDLDLLMEEVQCFYRKLYETTEPLTKIIEYFSAYGPIDATASYIKETKSSNIAFIAYLDADSYAKSAEYTGKLGRIIKEEIASQEKPTFYRIFMSTSNDTSLTTSIITLALTQIASKPNHCYYVPDKCYAIAYLSNSEAFFKLLNIPTMSIPRADDNNTSPVRLLRIIPGLCTSNDPRYIRIWSHNLPDKNISATKLCTYIRTALKISTTSLYAGSMKNRNNCNTNSCFFWFPSNDETKKLLKLKLKSNKFPNITFTTDEFKRKGK